MKSWYELTLLNYNSDMEKWLKTYIDNESWTCGYYHYYHRLGFRREEDFVLFTLTWL